MLRSRGYELLGSLDDLAPRTVPVQPEAAEADVSAAAIAALVALADDHRRLWRRHRRREKPGQTSGTGLGSNTRAASFALKTKALEGADRNRFLAWAARTYLKRTSGRSS